AGLLPDGLAGPVRAGRHARRDCGADKRAAGDVSENSGSRRPSAQARRRRQMDNARRYAAVGRLAAQVLAERRRNRGHRSAIAERSMASLQDRIAMHNGNRLKLGLFGANCSNGRAMTRAPERWPADWDSCEQLAEMADEAGIDFMLPIGRWKGYR